MEPNPKLSSISTYPSHRRRVSNPTEDGDDQRGHGQAIEDSKRHVGALQQLLYDEMDIKPIPAFYCCYLLRSTVRKGSFYVGSTPNPARRLAQHNGQSKGGAVRTSRLSLRPWEMTCIVAGFPSNIAALQFEWAWHNAHLTRHILADERLSFATTKVKTGKRTGRTRKKPGRPRTSLSDKLSNLHLLLRSPYFSAWPLEVRFFNKDVYEVWQGWCQRVDVPIRKDMTIKLDAKVMDDNYVTAEPPRQKRKSAHFGQGGVDGIDPTYAPMRDVVEKSQFLLDGDEPVRCAVCAHDVHQEHDLITLCPHTTCRGSFHISCISGVLLDADEDSALVPRSGACPSCSGIVEWSDVMKDLSLRLRGGKEVEKLLKKRTKRNNTISKNTMPADEDDEDDVNEQDDLDENEVFDVTDDDDDGASVTSVESGISGVGRSPTKAATSSRMEIVIEDSEVE